MARAEDISKISLLTRGEVDEGLIALCLDDAEEFALAYTNRKKIPAGLWRTVRELAIIQINRIGTEGESGRSEGGESYSFDSAPKPVYDALNRFRLARVGGKTHEYLPADEENETPEDGDVSPDAEGGGEG